MAGKKDLCYQKMAELIFAILTLGLLRKPICKPGPPFIPIDLSIFFRNLAMERISAGFFSSVATAPALDQEDDKVFSFYDQIILLFNLVV